MIVVFKTVIGTLCAQISRRAVYIFVVCYRNCLCLKIVDGVYFAGFGFLARMIFYRNTLCQNWVGE